MQGYDLFMLIVLVAAVVWGFWKGLAWQVASLASIVVSYFVALQFRKPLADLLHRSIEISQPLDIFLSMLILFLGSSLVVWVGFNLVSEAIERVKLKEWDHQAGALLGFAKGVVICVLITLFSVTLLSEQQREAICNSKSGYYIAMLLDRAGPIMPTELKEVLGPYMHELDQRIEHDHTEFVEDGTVWGGGDSENSGTEEEEPLRPFSRTETAPRSRFSRPDNDDWRR